MDLHASPPARSTRSPARRPIGTALVAACLLLAARAEARGRPAYFGFGFGSGIKMVESISQFKMSQELGYHLSGGASGFALALGLGESFGDGLVTFQAGPRLIWDIPVMRGAGLFVTPALQLGYGMRAPAGGRADHFFNAQVAIDLRLRLGGRLLLLFRPFALDMYFADPFWMRYDLLGGLGLAF